MAKYPVDIREVFSHLINIYRNISMSYFNLILIEMIKNFRCGMEKFMFLNHRVREERQKLLG